MVQRTFTLLRAVLLINMALMLLGLMRAGFIRMHVENDDDMDYVSNVQRRGAKKCPCSKSSGQDGVVMMQDDNVHMPSNVGEDRDANSTFQVPNVVHYIWFNTAPRPLQFHHMLSVLSADKMLDPDVIYFHTNMEPTGEYWNVVKALPKLKISYREPPTSLFGEKVKDPFYYTSHSNVDRVKLLMEYGGIYLDFDVLVTRPFDDLRRHTCTIGMEQETKACGSVIVCSKTSFFLYMWLNSYLDDYRIEEWAYNTGKVPYKLSRRYPHLVHVEKSKINRPNFQELDQIWGPTWFDWEKNYAVHIWYRLWKDTSPYFKGVEPNPQNVKTWNSTFGEMARSILYGNKKQMIRDVLE